MTRADRLALLAEREHDVALARVSRNAHGHAPRASLTDREADERAAAGRELRAAQDRLNRVREGTLPESRRTVIRGLIGIHLDELLELRGLPLADEIRATWPLTGGRFLDDVEAAMYADVIAVLHGDSVEVNDRVWSPNDDDERHAQREAGEERRDEERADIAASEDPRRLDALDA